MINILEVKNLCKKYEEFELDNVSFNLPYNSIMGFVGPNGSGKTTTIKSILGAVRGDSGTIELFGNKTRNGNLGVVLDTPLYVDDWTLNDIEKAVKSFHKEWESELFYSLLKRFHLDNKKKVKELSRGMKVKLQIAVALSHNAKLLVLDEPTSGLDPVARDEICVLLKEFISNKNRGVLFSTHITSDLEKVADYITFILNGKIMFTGTNTEMLNSYIQVNDKTIELNQEQKEKIIGYREFEDEFEGMINTSNLEDFQNIKRFVPTMESIIVYMNLEEKNR